MAGSLYVGTSGFAYKEWKGSFYPQGLKDREMLPYYAGRFPAVEINYTFRRNPSPATLTAWREATPDGFRFALKAHQRITHWLRLADADQVVSGFLDRARALGPRLGPILFQCPPSFHLDRPRLESFLAYLPPIFRYAFEFRHPSWDEARDVLASQGAAWCVAETDERPAGDDALPARPFAYLRLRRERYEDTDLRAWAARIEPVLAGGADVFCYFKHEEGTAAPRFAERLAELVAAGPASAAGSADTGGPVDGGGPADDGAGPAEEAAS